MKNILTDKRKNDLSTIVNNELHTIKGSEKNLTDNTAKIELVTCLGGSEDLPSYLLGAYAISGMRILQGTEKSPNKNDMTYRIKINSSISSLINNLDSTKVQEVGHFTETFLTAFVKKFYSDQQAKIIIEKDDDEKAQSALEKVHSIDMDHIIARVPDEIIKRIEKRAVQREGCKNKGMQYALLHPIYEGMLDDSYHSIKIGGRPEYDYIQITKEFLQEVPMNTNIYKGAIVTKSGKSPLYYPYDGENDFYKKNTENLSIKTVARKFGLRELDAKMIEKDIGLEQYIEFVNDFYLTNAI